MHDIVSFGANQSASVASGIRF